MPSSGELHVTGIITFPWIAVENIYIKDGDTIWSPGWKPCKTELDSYECRHGMNYTNIKGVKKWHYSKCTLFCSSENMGRSSETYTYK